MRCECAGEVWQRVADDKAAVVRQGMVHQNKELDFMLG